MASRSALLGIVPVLIAAPPTTSARSITHTLFPSLAAWIAARWPAGPLPITQRSHSRIEAVPSVARAGAGKQVPRVRCHPTDSRGGPGAVAHRHPPTIGQFDHGTQSMSKPTTAQIRQTFVDYFVQRHAHRFVPSSPVIPHEDPTLLFTNAGMNQFKPVFLGPIGRRATSDRAGRRRTARSASAPAASTTTSRTSGKDTYHHTFFEMLGNWSFGDYFKRESLKWAWELLTKVYGLPDDRAVRHLLRGQRRAGARARRRSPRPLAAVPARRSASFRAT